jgi:2-iminobutanoate/2-iminopropanoate deaminase
MARALNPAAIAPPLARYSHGVLVPAGHELLVTSGQLALGPDGAVPDDVEAQCVLVFEALRAILAEGGMDFSDVVQFRAYVTDRAYFPVYGAVRARYVAGDAYASTLIVVSGFTRPEFKVEVELTAARPHA